MTTPTLADLHRTLDLILEELRALRAVQLPVAEDHLVHLLDAIFASFASAPFTALWVLEWSLEPDAEGLRRAIVQVIGQRPTAQKLSRLLRRSLGLCGPWRLALVCEHSREGRTFMVTNRDGMAHPRLMDRSYTGDMTHLETRT